MRGGTCMKLHQGQQNPNINSNSCTLSPCRKSLCGIFSIWLSRSTLHASPLRCLTETAEPWGLHRWSLCLLLAGGTRRRQKHRKRVRSEILLFCFFSTEDHSPYQAIFSLRLLTPVLCAAPSPGPLRTGWEALCSVLVPAHWSIPCWFP